MRLRGVRTLVPEGTLTCRTHTTQHELSAIAPNFQWAQLFASLGFADIRVGATSADIAFEAVRTCTHVRMHAHPCAACTQAPAALKPSRLFAYTLGTYCANQIRSGVAPVSAVTLLQATRTKHPPAQTAPTGARARLLLSSGG